MQVVSFLSHCISTLTTFLLLLWLSTKCGKLRGPCFGVVELSGGSCDFELHKDVDLRRPDQVRSAYGADQCRSMCESCREFACRSFSYAASTGLCSMSGDDTVSLGGFALRMTPGVGFYQKPFCPDRESPTKWGLLRRCGGDGWETDDRHNPDEEM